MSTVKDHLNEDLMQKGSIETTIDDVFEKIRDVDPHDSTGDAAMARKLGLSKSAPGQSRSKNTLPYAAIVEYCLRKRIDLNWIFNNKVDKNGGDEAGVRTRNNIVHSTEPEITEEDIRDAMLCISSEIARAQLQWSESVVEMLVKTYFNFRHNTGVDIKTVVRAVAESQVK